MCLILIKEPKGVIDFDKFKIAIENNPDGYGMTVSNDGSLEVQRSLKSPDPEFLYRVLSEEFFDEKVMLHLRYTTAGNTSLRNCHPFPILEKNKDGIDLRMCHNGTLYTYKNRAKDGESDTRLFVREFVRPLFKRLIRGMEPEELLTDPFVSEILDDKLTSQSVITFMDGKNNTLVVNEKGNGGVTKEGVYYSNIYSFNKHHRTGVPQGKKSQSGVNNGQTTCRSTTKNTPANVNSTKSTPIEKFTDKFNVTIPDLLLISDRTIKELVSGGYNTVNTELLIKELLLVVYQQNKKIKRYQGILNKSPNKNKDK